MPRSTTSGRLIWRLLATWALVSALANLAAPPKAQAAVGANGLLLYLKMDESSGTSANDEALNGDGTLTGFTSGYWVSSFSGAGNALTYGGAQRVSIPHNSQFNDITGTTGMSIAAWVTVNNTSGVKALVHRQIGTGNGEYFSLAIDGTDVQVWMNGAGSVDCGSSQSWTNGTWYHVAMTWDGSNVRLYRNGSLLHTCAYSQSSLNFSDSNGFNVGAGKDGGTFNEYHNGKLDDVLVYKRVLTGTELTNLAAGQSPVMVTTKYWIGSSESSFADDTKWSSTATGSNDVSAPVAGDTAIFTSNYNGNAYFASAPSVAAVTLQSGYTGTVGVTPAASNASGLEGDFYSGVNFDTFVGTYADTTVNYNPSDTMLTTRCGSGDQCSARWTGEVYADSAGSYTFYTQSDDGVRLWVNGTQLVNDWNDQGSTENSGAISLSAGTWYSITLEYYEAGGGGVIQLSYQGPSIAKQIIPSTKLRYNAAPTVATTATITGALTVAGGTFVMPSGSFSIGSLTFSGGTLNAASLPSWTYTGSYTQSGGVFVPPTTWMTVTSDFNVSAGTFGAPPTLTVGGAFNQTGGAFTHNSGVVKLGATSPKTLVNSGGSFYDLEIGASTAETGLVGHWKLDENTGTTTADSAGNGMTGTLTGSPTWTTGYSGSALSFSSGKYVRVPYNAAMGNITSAVTISAWFTRNAAATGDETILSRWKTTGGTGHTRHYNLQWDNSNRPYFETQENWAQIPTSPTQNTSTWYHIAAVYNGTNVQFYWNGVAQGSAVAVTSGLAADTVNALLIGAYEHYSSGLVVDGHWNGKIDEVRLYSRALNATEVDNIYDGYAAGGAPTGTTHTLGSNITVADDLTIGSGTGLTLSTYTLTVNDGWTKNGTFTASTGTVVFTGSSRTLPNETFYNLTINATAGQTLTQGSALTVQNDLTISTGTLATANYALDVTGSFVNSSTFTAGTGTVTLSGTSAGKSLTSGGSSFHNLTINSSNGSGSWTLGSGTTTVSNTLAITSGTVAVGANWLVADQSNFVATLGGASGNTAAVTLSSGLFTVRGGLTIGVTGTLSMTGAGQLEVGGLKTLTINGTLSESHGAGHQNVAATAGSKPRIFPSFSNYSFTVAGATAVVNLDGVDITGTDTSGVTVTSATSSTFTAFKNIRFTGGTGARYVYVSATKLGLFMDDCYFDNSTTANVVVADSSPASKDVRISLRYKDSTQNGSGAGESRDSDDDSGADGVADGSGGVVEWLTYYPDLTSTGTGVVAGFPTAAFDWDDFSSYGTYVAMNDVNGSGDAILFARNTDGSNKAYSATISAANGDIIGTPRWWNAVGSNTRYVFVAVQTSTTGRIYKYQDTGSALTLISNWPFANATYMGQITTPLTMDDQYLYVAATNPSDSATKYIFRIDHTASNPNTSYTTYTYASSGATASAITASPALNWYTSKPYVFFVNQGRVVRTDGTTFSSSIYASAGDAPSTTVSGRVAVSANILYYGDNNGVVAVKNANDTTAPYFENIWSYTSTSCTLCRILGMTVGFEPTDTSTYPRVYWGDGDGEINAIRQNGTGGSNISGFPFVTTSHASTATVSFTAPPLYQNGIVIVGNDGGDVFIVNQASSGAGAPAIMRQQFLGGGISAVSRDFLAGKYLVVAGVRLHMMDTYSDPDAFR